MKQEWPKISNKYKVKQKVQFKYFGPSRSSNKQNDSEISSGTAMSNTSAKQKIGPDK